MASSVEGPFLGLFYWRRASKPFFYWRRASTKLRRRAYLDHLTGVEVDKNSYFSLLYWFLSPERSSHIQMKMIITQTGPFGIEGNSQSMYLGFFPLCKICLFHINQRERVIVENGIQTRNIHQETTHTSNCTKVNKISKFSSTMVKE